MATMSTIDYGTLGHVEYQAQKGEWGFVRRSKSPQGITPLGSPALLVPPSVDGSAPSVAKGGRQKLALQFTGSHTEFVPAVNQIVDMYEESRDVLHLSQWAVSKTSPLVVIASSTEAQPLVGSSHTSRRVLVYAAGISGNKIGVAIVQQQRFAKDNLLIRRPSIKPQLETVFECDGPIEQIQPVYEVETRKTKPYVVIRTQKSIYIVQITSESASRVGLPLFGAVCLGTIEAGTVGCSDFLHIAVNPWKGEEIAFVDVGGKWNVWDFSLRKTQKTRYAPTTPKLIASGELYEPNQITLAWANITWGSVEAELLVATRKELFKIGTTTGSITDVFRNVVRGLPTEVEIISVVRPQIKPDSLLILTNYTLQILELAAEIKPILSWKHCRHPQDRSLSCSAWNVDDTECVFIYSRYNPNISVIWGLNSREPLDFSFLAAKWSDCPILGLIVLEGSTEENTKGETNRRSDIFTVTTIGSNHDVWRQDYTLNSNIDARIFHNNRRGNYLALSNQIIDSSDESDGQGRQRGSRDESADLGSTFERLSLGTSRRCREVSNVSIINLGNVYELAFDDERPIYKTGAQEDGRLFLQEYLNILRLHLNPDNDDEADTINPSLLSFLHLKKKMEGLFDDLSMLSIGVDGLVHTGSTSTSILNLGYSQNPNEIFRILRDLFEESDSQGDLDRALSPEALYDSLSRVWLEALPVDAPPRLRLRRERLARMIAIEISLSSLGAYPRLVASERSREPAFPGGGVQSSSQSVGTLQSSSSYLTDEDDNIMETGRVSGPSSRGSSRSGISSSQLRMFLENFTPVVHVPVIGGDIDGLLTDWDVGQSPENYQWRPVFEIQQQIVADFRNSESRPRSRSRKGSRRRDQSASSTAKNGYMHGIRGGEDFPMTQPATRTETATLIPISSSQATSTQRLPASQVHRGKYGDSRKTKKRRTEGF
ncbi:hypothetical protein EYR41_009198 [Orbilia oligospora]|uniref:Uncharacterized protein n=1 Tax=Orbilia oligospora TaxID=2813651 RepID=A0A8H2HN31_ORBOL|nr:hypothetical protein EYR41_009198 [Orbilia oligospora]